MKDPVGVFLPPPSGDPLFDAVVFVATGLLGLATVGTIGGYLPFVLRNPRRWRPW